jgi:hypothetical protein
MVSACARTIRLGRASLPAIDRPVMPRRFNALIALALLLWHSRSGRLHVFSARPLRTSAFFVRYGLPDLKRLDGRSFDGAVVEEQLAAFSADESKSFVRDQLLDRTV